MEITLSRQTLKKAIGIFLVIALFFGMSSPALPYLPKVSFEADAVGGDIVSSGNCGGIKYAGEIADYYDGSAKFNLYADGTLEIFGKGTIATSEFEGDPAIKKVIIREGINSIDSSHLYDYKGFEHCKNLKSVEFPDSFVEFYGGGYIGVFEGCTSLENVRLPKNLEYLPHACFSDCTSLKFIEIPASVTEIHTASFRNCSSLETIKFNDGLEYIGDIAFSGCNIKELNFPSTLKTIDNDAFENCNSLETINFNEGLEVIGGSAFYGCNIKELNFPSTLKTIDNGAFSDCASLETINFNEGLEYIGEVAFVGCNIKELNFPSTLKTIDYSAFSHCNFLETINLNDGLEDIGGGAFMECIYLKEVTIPKTITSIGEGLFTDCIRLSKVTVMNPDCDILYDRGTLPETAVIYGYSGSTAEKYAKDWLRKFVPLDKEHDHEFESKVVVRATCTETGVEEFTCYCGEAYTAVIPTNYHFDVDGDDNCDMCGTKLNIYNEPVTPNPDPGGDNGSTETPDEGGTTNPEGDGPTDIPDDNDNDAPQKPESMNMFTSFIESMMNFLKNLFNIFNFFNK